MLPLRFFFGSFISKKYAEIIENKIGIDFLFEEFRFFTMEVEKSVGMFEVAEGDFDAPTPMINLFDIIQIKRKRKIRDKVFISVITGFNFQDAELQEAKMASSKEFLKVRNRFVRIHVMVNIVLLFHDVGIFVSEKSFYRDIKFLLIIGKVRRKRGEHASAGSRSFYAEYIFKIFEFTLEDRIVRFIAAVSGHDVFFR